MAEQPTEAKARRKVRLLAPLGGLAALATRLGRVGGGDVASLGHHGAAGYGANALGQQAATGAATHSGAGMGVAGGASQSSAGVAGATGATGAGSSAAPAAGMATQAMVGVGAVAASAVVALGVIAVVRDPEPETVAAPIATTVPVAAPPAAEPVAFAVDQGGVLAEALLANDERSPQGQQLQVQAIDGSPAVGTPVTLGSGAEVAAGADGSFSYNPNDAFISLAEGQTTSDAFTYTVADNSGWSEDRSATITINGVNDEPAFGELVGATAVEEESSSVELAVIDPDGDSVTFSLDESAPPFAAITDSGNGAATLVLTPSAGQAGTYELVITATDSGAPGLSATTTLSVTVTAAPKPPVVETRVTDRLSALYDFGEGSGSAIASSGGSGVAPSLAIADPDAVSWGQGTLTVNSPTVITSSGGADALAASMAGSNELTVEAWVTAANIEQAGPARIVSLSSTVESRNVTLAQGEPDGVGGDRWTARLRSTTTTDNGLPMLAASPGSATTELTHLVFTRSESGETRLYVDGVLAATDPGGGDLSNWDIGHSLLLANELTGERPWLGTYHLVALYNKALSPGEVEQNRRVGP